MKKIIAIALLLLPSLTFCQGEPDQDLTKLGIEDLMNVEVTTASKTAQSISKVPAPIYVITNEDIRRSGAQSVPEALRLAPGMVVAQIDSTNWMVSIRGFTLQGSNKLLILLDGRPLYSQMSSTVYWDSLDIPLEDVDRIEVIRGPGGALWGSHAVNGVINIITKSAHDTQGGSVTGLLASDLGGNFGFQYGSKLSSRFDYRIYVREITRQPFDTASGKEGEDDLHALRSGFRIDGDNPSGDQFTLIGDIQASSIGRSIDVYSGIPPFISRETLRVDTHDASLLGRWQRSEKNGSSQQLQASYAHIDHAASEVRDTFDINYQKKWAEKNGHAWTLGVGFQSTSDNALLYQIGPLFDISPRYTKQEFYSAFLHDTINLGGNKKLLLGSEFEHNPYTGWEVQPSAQLLYTPSANHTYWASVSRAVRVPERIDTGVKFGQPTGFPAIVNFLGNPDFQSEEVTTAEIGTRFTTHDNLFIDCSAFYSFYDKLATAESGTPYFDVINGYMVYPVRFENMGSGQTAGVEAVVKAKINPRWSLSGSYSLYSQRFRSEAGSTDTSEGEQVAGAAIRNQFQLHSNLDLGSKWQFDTDLYYVGALTTRDVPAFWKLDARIGWIPTKDCELSFGIKNAFDPEHFEAGKTSFQVNGAVPRTIYLKATWKF